jgi:8-oxo-dGTP diphosphatase
MVEIPWIPAPACDEGEMYWVHADELKDLDTPPTDWYIYQYVNEEEFFVFNAAYDIDLKLITMTEEMSNRMIC